MDLQGWFNSLHMPSPGQVFVCYPALPSLSCGSWPHGHIMAAALPGITYTSQEGRKGSSVKSWEKYAESYPLGTW